MIDFLAHLFDTSGFPPRWDCGNWSAGHGWLHILSDLGIWSAYVAIPCVLGYFVLRRRDIPFRRVFLLFGAFILACGTTHLMEAIIFWWPAYRLAGVIKLLTAIVSWSTVLALVPVTPKSPGDAQPRRAGVRGRRPQGGGYRVAGSERGARTADRGFAGERGAFPASWLTAPRIMPSFCSTRAAGSHPWNPGAQRIKQYRAEEIIGQHFSRFYPEEDIRSRKPEQRARDRCQRGAVRGRGMAATQGRLPFLGERGDHGAARRSHESARLFEDHPGYDRASRPRKTPAGCSKRRRPGRRPKRMPRL